MAQHIARARRVARGDKVERVGLDEARSERATATGFVSDTLN